jgi:hypothetical protein
VPAPERFAGDAEDVAVLVLDVGDLGDQRLRRRNAARRPPLFTATAAE